jgi:ribonucleoside-diphosphate reductase alpha chain
MRGADASAGTIKSGGKTRRAAKMVVLDVDHPDIEEFIETKAARRTRSAPCATPASTWTSTARTSSSVQYQNANNSVRVTDEFMQAVEDDGRVRPCGRKDGSVIETIDARDLMRKIARPRGSAPTRACSTTTTINDWHTNPETGRINGSNPCSEYMHLDNSSCNLASLNLLKFLDDDDTFDVEGFQKVVELIITGQDISSASPTSRPTRSGHTRDFRQLGIGYANLGALLMATRPPYDSDGGRAWAAAITEPDDRARLQATLRPSQPHRGPVRRVRPQRRAHMRRHAQAPAANDAVRTSTTSWTAELPRAASRRGTRRQARREERLSATPRRRCSPPPAPSAS